MSRPRRPEPTNPWGLTERQVEVMRHIAATGSIKAASARLGLSYGATNEHTQRARQRIGASTWVVALLEFDRWARKAA
jgi:DNA-binding NarL/FixJ family response regulator